MTSLDDPVLKREPPPKWRVCLGLELVFPGSLAQEGHAANLAWTEVELWRMSSRESLTQDNVLFKKLLFISYSKFVYDNWQLVARHKFWIKTINIFIVDTKVRFLGRVCVCPVTGKHWVWICLGIRPDFVLDLHYNDVF